MHGTPRPVDASVARPGMPTLNLAVSDAVMLRKHTAGMIGALQLGPDCALTPKSMACNAQAPTGLAAAV